MPGSLNVRSHRAEGSWVPRLVGIGVVGAIAITSVVYLGVVNHPHPASHRRPSRASGHSTPSARVVAQQTVGLINFGSYEDGDPITGDRDEHPLMLALAKGDLLRFVPIPRSALTNGEPQWTADQMADGTDIFIYNPTGKCLAASPRGGRAELARCSAVGSQRWRPVYQAAYSGQPFAAYANAQTGECLTAPVQPAEMKQPAPLSPATLQACGPTRTKSQEIAFWWAL